MNLFLHNKFHRELAKGTSGKGASNQNGVGKNCSFNLLNYHNKIIKRPPWIIFRRLIVVNVVLMRQWHLVAVLLPFLLIHRARQLLATEWLNRLDLNTVDYSICIGNTVYSPRRICHISNEIRLQGSLFGASAAGHRTSYCALRWRGLRCRPECSRGRIFFPAGSLRAMEFVSL